jgi:glucoamylase
MRSTIIFTVLAFCAAVFAQSLVDKYVESGSTIAKAGILANIGPSGSKASGAAVCSI